MSNVLFTSSRTKIKSGIGFKPCNLEITDEYFSYQIGSLAAVAFGVGVGGAVGAGIGEAISANNAKKNGAVVIPRSEITNVTAKKGFGTAKVFIDTVNSQQIVLACFSKSDMETIANLLSK